MNIGSNIHQIDLRYNYLRALAIVMVIYIHSSALLLEYSTHHVGFNLEYITYAVVSIIYTAVPLFVMISGALILRKEEPVLVFFKKRFSRVMIPFLVWNVIVYSIVYVQEGGRSVIGYISGLFNKTVFENGAHSIYWYIYTILGLYLLTPILRIVCQKADKKMMYYIFFLLVTFFCMNEIIPGITIFKRFNCSNLEYLMYFIGGYVITNYFNKEKYFKTLSVLGLILGWGLLIARFMITNTGEDYQLFRVIACFSIFSFFFCLKNPIKETRISPIITMISEYSYGIYLSHFLFLSCILRIPHFMELPILIEFILLGILTLMTTCTALFIGKKLGLSKLIM